jgi:uncharacterized protein (DUF362 family)
LALTRRTLFLFLAFLALATLLLKRGLLKTLISRPARKGSPGEAENRFRSKGKVLVGIAGEANVEASVRRAVSLIGGTEKLDVSGKTVLVKPNVVSGKPNPATTNPEVVRAVVKILLEAGAKEVYVGDMSALITLATSSTLRNMEKNGLRKAAEEAGAKVVGFENSGWVEVDLPEARYIRKALVTEWLYRVDLVVNLPVLKTHRSAGYSICLKNFIGCTNLRQRPYLVNPARWEELVAEFNLAYCPALNIVDGTVAMIENGPWEGTPAATNLIIASGDRVAADIVGLGIIKAFGRWAMVADKSPWEQKQVRHAMELGLGRPKKDIFLAVGEGDKKFSSLIGKVREFTGLVEIPVD